MSGTTGGWQMPNLGALAAMGGAGGWGGQDAATGTAAMTPDQQQAMRQRLYAQALLGQTSAAPQRSGWGATSNAMAPLLGAAMMRYAGQPQGAQVTSGTPNLAWNPNNPVGTSTLGGATANQGSWLGNLGSSLFG